MKHSWSNSPPKHGEDRKCTASMHPSLAKDLTETKKFPLLKGRICNKGFAIGGDAVRSGQAWGSLSTSCPALAAPGQPGRRKGRSSGVLWGTLPCVPQALRWEQQGSARPRAGLPCFSPLGTLSQPLPSPTCGKRGLWDRGWAACLGVSLFLLSDVVPSARIQITKETGSLCWETPFSIQLWASVSTDWQSLLDPGLGYDATSCHHG